MPSEAQQPPRPDVARDAGALLSPVAGELKRLRSRAWTVLVVGAAALLGSVAIASLLSIGLVDYLVRLPGWMRGAMLLCVVAGMALAAQKWLIPALRFRPSLTEVALRVEKSEEAQKAGLRGVLASGLELSEARYPTDLSGQMGMAVAFEARKRFEGVRAGSVVRLGETRQHLLALAVCIVGIVGIVALAGPRMFGIGFTRVAMPWADTQWPKRTELADATGAEVHALGSALPLRAAVLRTDQAPGQTKVIARYRLIGPGGAAMPTRVQLTGQGHSVDPQDRASGELYERLIEPAALGIQAGATGELEYWFEARDDVTEARRIRLVEPPSVVSATATIAAPAYSAKSSTTAFASGNRELGAGTDQRAVVGPVLAGSEIELTVKLSKPVPGPASGGAEAVRAFLAEAAPGAELGDVAATFAPDSWTLRLRAEKSLRVPLRPVDEFGIASRDEAAFSFDVIEDRPPSATVVEPREDEQVLPTARLTLGAEGRDDVGVAKLEMTHQRAAPPKGSMGAAPEPSGDPVSLASSAFVDAQVQTQAAITAELDLSAFEPPLEPGQEVWVFAIASDTYEIDGTRHEPVRSTPRKLRIIGEQTLVEQVRSELAAIRKLAIRMDEEQGAVQKAVEGRGVTAEDRRRQDSLTQRLQQQTQTIDRLNQRLERNQLEDEALTGLLEDVQGALEEAAQNSGSAATGMDQAAERSPHEEQAELTPQESERIAGEQQEVRDALQRLAEALDRGEDTWVLSRTLERLLEQQRDLQQRTQQAGERTMGKRPEDLTAGERAELQQLAEQQQRLSESAQRAIEELAERAKQMEKADPTQAEGMRNASERGRQQQVPQKMEEAGKNVEQNQTSSAEAQQQEAMESLEGMLSDLEESAQNRDEALKRTLATLLQQLDALIAQQDTQIAALEAAKEKGDYAGLDAPMIELNTGTIDTASTARADRATAAIAEIIDRASKNQSEAIGALRAAPVDAEKAEQAERESLRLLRLAKAEAQKLQQQAQQRENEKKKAELRQAYREALEKQVAIQGQTEPFVGKTIDRRDRLKVRAIGDAQEELRVSLDELRTKTAELADAGVFAFAHERLDSATGIAAKRLKTAQADQAVVRNQASAVRVLTSLLEALDDRAKQNDEFREEESGGGGSGSGEQQDQPLIPPIAELKLLREMQQDVRDLTEAIDGDGSGAEEVPALGKFQRGLAERAQELLEKMQQEQMPPVDGGEEGGDEPAEPEEE